PRAVRPRGGRAAEVRIAGDVACSRKAARYEAVSHGGAGRIEGEDFGGGVAVKDGVGDRDGDVDLEPATGNAADVGGDGAADDGGGGGRGGGVRQEDRAAAVGGIADELAGDDGGFAAVDAEA